LRICISRKECEFLRHCRLLKILSSQQVKDITSGVDWANPSDSDLERVEEIVWSIGTEGAELGRSYLADFLEYGTKVLGYPSSTLDERAIRRYAEARYCLGLALFLAYTQVTHDPESDWVKG
jgi:hypothetical protein